MQTAMVLWGNEVRIQGRADAVQNARRVLMFLIIQGESIGMPGITRVSLREIRRELRMPRRTIYNALERLIDQHVIQKIWCVGVYWYAFNFTPPGDEETFERVQWRIWKFEQSCNSINRHQSIVIYWGELKPLLFNEVLRTFFSSTRTANSGMF